MKEEAVSPLQPQHSVAAIPSQCEPQPSSASWDLFPPPLPATQLKCSQTSELADPKCCRLVTALLCRELPPGKELPLPPFLGGHRGVMAVGRCPCTFGARLGVFGHAPGTARREQGSAGGCAQAAAMCRVSSHPRGVASSTPMSPSAHGNAPLLLFGMQPVPPTPVGPERGSGCLTNNLPSGFPTARPSPGRVPGGGGASYARRVHGQESFCCLRGEAGQPTKGIITYGCKALSFQNLPTPPITCFLRAHRPFFGRGELGCGG